MEKTGKRKRTGLLAAILLLVLCLVPARALAAGNEEKTFQFIVDNMNLSPAAACGIMGSIKAESNFTPAIYGLGGAYGLCQWSTYRAANMRSYCEKHSLASDSLEGQLSFLHYELEHSFPSVYSYLKSVPNTADGAYKAGYYFCYHFEAPGNAASASAYRASIAKNTFWPRYGLSAFYLSASSTSKGVKLSWSGAGKLGLQVKRSETRDGTYTVIATLDAGTSSYLDSTAKKKTYYYYVSAVSLGGETGRSNIESVTLSRSLKDEECSIEVTGGPFAYTGKAITPKVKVYYDGTKLKKGKDYKLSFSKNKNAGTATVTIKGLDVYKGTVKRTFVIEKAVVRVRASDLNAEYAKGKSLKPKVTIKGARNVKYKLVSSDPSVVSVSGTRLKIKRAGTAVVTVKIPSGSNYQAAKKTFTVTITPPRPVITSLKKAEGGLKAGWRKLTGIDGVEIQYAQAEALKEQDPVVDVKGTGKKALLLKLTEKGVWRVRLRSYVVLPDGSRFYSKWSKAKNGKL